MSRETPGPESADLNQPRPDPREIKDLKTLSNEELLTIYQELQRGTNVVMGFRDSSKNKVHQDAVEYHQKHITKEFTELNRYQNEIDKRVSSGTMERPLTMQERDSRPRSEGGFKKEEK